MKLLAMMGIQFGSIISLYKVLLMDIATGQGTPRSLYAQDTGIGTIASPDHRIVEFSKCREIADFADKAELFLPEIREALDRDTIEIPKYYGMNMLHWIFVSGNVELFEKFLGKASHEQIRLLINEVNGAKSVDESSYLVDGRVGPAFNKDTPDGMLVFLCNYASPELKVRYEEILSKLQKVLIKGDFEGDGRNNTGNNRLNLYAAGSLENMKWCYEMYEGSTDDQSYLGNRTDREVTVMHHAARSKHQDNLHVLAFVIVERGEIAEDDLYHQDFRGYIPLRHIDFDRIKFNEIIQFVKMELERKSTDVEWQRKELARISKLLSVQIDQIEAKKKSLGQLIEKVRDGRGLVSV